MNQNQLDSQYLPTILIVRDHQAKLMPSSLVLSSLNQVYVSVQSAAKILTWVQEHQPALIFVDLKYSEVLNLSIISALRLDWLTRNIPIIVIESLQSQVQKKADLDCDVYLTRPYSTRELEKVVCSFAPISACHNDQVVSQVSP